jgi:hypothetical protein
VSKREKNNNNIQRVLKITVTQVTFIGTQQSNIKSKQNFPAKQNPDIQVKNKLRVRNMGALREAFRLVVAAIDDTRKTIHELKKTTWMNA